MRRRAQVRCDKWTYAHHLISGPPSRPILLIAAHIDGAKKTGADPDYTDNAKKIIEDPQFSKLGAAGQEKALTLLQSSIGNKSAMGWASDALGALGPVKNPDAKVQMLDGFVQGLPLSAAKVIDVKSLVDSPKFGALSESDQKLVAATVQGSKADSAVSFSIKKLIEDPKFASLKPDEKTAVLSQAANYPNSRSIDRMQQMLQKDWFQGFDLGDKQRVLKFVAYLAQHPGDKTVIDNTLDRFLSPKASYTLDFEAAKGTNGSALNGVFHMNRDTIAADNAKADTSDASLDVIVNTPVHEVNHLVNSDTVSKTFDYFMRELRANYAQFQARYGREPDRKALAGMAQYILKHYPDINDALQGVSGKAEQDKVLKFMADVLGWDVKELTPANAATKGINPAATNPLPKVPGDTDN